MACAGAVQFRSIRHSEEQRPARNLQRRLRDSQSSRVRSAGPRGENHACDSLPKTHARDKRVTDESPALPYAAPFEYVLMSSNRKPGVRTLAAPRLAGDRPRPFAAGVMWFAGWWRDGWAHVAPRAGVNWRLPRVSVVSVSSRQGGLRYDAAICRWCRSYALPFALSSGWSI